VIRTRRPYRLPGPAHGLAIGLLGGSFDPPHSGHVHVADAARKALGLDWVWVIPAAGNPLKRTQTPFEARLEATRKKLSGPRTRVSSIEQDLGLRYTVDLIAAIRARAPGARLVWIIGADNLSGFHRWRRWRTIARTIPVCVVSRPGASPKAGLGRFARMFAAARLPEGAARCLAVRKPPAWVVISAPHDPSSSTALRAARG
jgi:nicotinate-nucleotide adenylyltransferase